MKFTTLFGSLALLATSALALTIPTFEDAQDAIEKRAGTFAITGAPGAVRPRYEVRQLKAQHPAQFTLFLLAMKAFQAEDQGSLTSYYQIAGIHGVPRQNWDNVGRCSSCSGADGYCTHDSILFLGWHRAYLALFEQRLVAVAKQIASQYPAAQRSNMQAAAAALRLPFWDWAAKPPGGNVLATVFTSASVTVQGPSGKQTFTNPLFRHTFASTSALVYTPFVNWKNTLRYPTSNAANAGSNEAKAVQSLNNIRASMQDQVYQIFSTCDTFLEVGSDNAGQASTQCSNSFENIHNTIHTTTGGPKVNGISGGTMTYLSTAAFDPIFWLHHANVDRLFAMWQAVNPNSYSGTQVAPHNTWTIAQGSTQGVNSPLQPFHRDTSGTTWTTNGVRNTKTFHYTYPEFVDSDGSKASIVRYVNALYGPNANKAAGSSKRSVMPGSILAERDTTPLVANNGSLFQYVANIQTARYALGGSYQIYLFNGDPVSEDPASWLLDQNLIGPMGVLATDTMTSSNLVASGSIPLTRTLTDMIGQNGLTDLSEAVAVPYLATNLRWRIAGPNGSEVDPTTVPDFDVSVYASTATQNSPDELPVWSAFVPLADVTMGKAGGATAASLNITEVAGNATAAVTSAVGQVASQVTGLVGSATALLGGATATA